MRVNQVICEDDINFEPRDVQYSATRGNAPNYSNRRPTKIEKLGSGVATIVYQKQEKPHEVFKLTFRVRSITGNYLIEFLKACIKHEGNPLLPKIYKVKVLRKPPEDNDGPRFMIFVESEKLEDGFDLNWKEWSYLYRMYVGMSIKEVSKQLEREFSNFDKGMALSIFGRLLRELIARETGLGVVTSFTRDREIVINNRLAIKAVRGLKDVIRNVPGIWNDMGLGNVMFRRTPTGIWPVLTDPFHQSV